MYKKKTITVKAFVKQINIYANMLDSRSIIDNLMHFQKFMEV